MDGIAFKVTYNDGGNPGGIVGFKGVCSQSTMHYNVREAKRANCSADGGPCRVFVEKNFSGRAPSLDAHEPWCYESTLLSTAGRIRFGAGFYHRGDKEGQPIPMHGGRVGDIALLTTRRPYTTEADRYIFGLFRIGRREERGDWGEVVESDGTMDVILPDDVALQMRFWNYYQNTDGGVGWNTGLFRYPSPDAVNRCIADVMAALGDSDDRDRIYLALNQTIQPSVIAPKTGLGDAAGGRGGTGGRGGGGGEGAAHRQLKEYVAANPAVVGLPAQSVARIEHPFASGDIVDVYFDLPDGRAAVVEIETWYTLTGAHQCIKYRALAEAARGEPLQGGRVEAILVAHGFDLQTAPFAQQYGIRSVKLSGAAVGTKSAVG